MNAKRIAIGFVLVVVVLAAIVAALNFRGEDSIPDNAAPFSPTPEQIKRGEYLTRAGNCIACHTARGGVAYAGALGVRTPFGTVMSTNLTPDLKTGIGSWTPAHFWRALHNGRSKDGRLLYPAFPYPNYTQVTREDSDAIFAYLLSLPPAQQANRPHALRFPYNSQAALAVWRALFFEPETFAPDSSKAADWNRGAYLVRGLGHCVACHSPRNAFGATDENLELSGGLVPMQGWYAPSLTSMREAGVGGWETRHVVDLLKAGVSEKGSVMGPMAEVVFRSTQYLSQDDLRAMAVFLKALPQSSGSAAEAENRGLSPISEEVRAKGSKIYEQSCASCHGDDGEGAPGAYPALAGNRAVTMGIAANLVRVVLSGGYLPATAANPRPYGMPPFAHVLSDTDIAAVVTFIRGAWGNTAEPVSQLQVMKSRAGEPE
ncbi:MAG: alcohol dehydrogenase [Betaproteobacteria bacterium]|nr:alcohol dehydrogenase [Betaproteobacteria bacterium]